MANTYVDYTAVASQTDYNFSFEYLRDEHVKVKVNDVIVTNYTIVTSPTPTKIRFNTAPAAGAEIKIYRDSRGDYDPLVDFQDGSVLTQEPLDTAYLHNLYVAQETSEGVGGELLFKKNGIDYDAEGNKIINLGTPGDSTDAANKGYVDQTIDNAIALGGSPAIVSLGGYDVTALGSLTARSLADRFADVVNVLDYGVSTTETPANNSIAFQNAINAGNTIFVPEGTYEISDPLVLPRGKSIIGAEGAIGTRTTIRKTTTNVGSGTIVAPNRTGVNDDYAVDAVIQIKGTDNNFNYFTVVKNLQIEKSSYSANSYGIYAPRTANSIFENLYILNVTTGFFTHESWMTVMTRVTVQACEIGFRWADDGSGFAAGTSLKMSDCWVNFDNNVADPKYGFWFFGVHYSTLASCGCDNGIWSTGHFIGYRIHLCKSMSINGTGIENCAGTALDFENSSAVVNGFNSFNITGGNDISLTTNKGTLDITGSDVTFTALDMSALGSNPNSQKNWVIQTGSHVVNINPRSNPTGGSSFISYSGGSSVIGLEDGNFTKTSASTSYDLDSIAPNSWDAFGTATLSSGVAAVSHGLSSTPSFVQARLVNPSDAVYDVMVQVTAKFTGSFTVRAINISTGTANFGNHSIEWWAKL